MLTLFFFLSGIFFKCEPLKVFITKKIQTLIIPFLCFYLLSYPFRILLHLWDHRTLAGFDWACILDLFDIQARSDYLFVNVPLWFIMCLVVMQAIYYIAVMIIPKRARTAAILAAIITILLFDSYIVSYPTIFMINNAIHWMPYFAIGNLCGQALAKYVLLTRYRLTLIYSSLATFLILQYIPISSPEYFTIKALILFAFLMAAMSYWNGRVNTITQFLRTLGVSTLFILCAHIPVQIFFQRIFHLVWGSRDVWTGLLDVIFTVLILYIGIPIIDRYAPWLVGKHIITHNKPIPCACK